MIEAVIFDMDGVLIDSPKYIIQSFSKALEPYGIRHGEEEHKKLNGLGLKTITEIWKKENNVDIDIMSISKAANDVEIELMRKEVKMNNELITFLDELKDNNVPVAVGSSSLRHRIDKLLELHKLSKYFTCIVSADDVENHKPNPDIFLECAKRIDVKKENCVVFEDAPHGIEAAIRAGMKVIAVKTQYHTIEELSKANLIINNFGEINLDKIRDL